MKGKLIVFSGPSGVGKGTIRKYINFKDYVFSVSSTTRKIREGELEGVDYHFISKEEFQAKVAADKMLEYAEFCDNFYGTDKDTVTELLNQGKNVFLEIECQGSLQVLEKLPEAISIFVLPPSLLELEKRLKGRGTEDDTIITMRLKKAREEIKLKDHYKYNVINDNLEHVASEVDKILYRETK